VAVKRAISAKLIWGAAHFIPAITDLLGDERHRYGQINLPRQTGISQQRQQNSVNKP
jgi:hypothetical protein